MITLKEARAQAGLSMADVARAMDVGKTIVHDREHGTRGFPPGQLERFADLCGVAAGDLDVPEVDRYPLPNLWAINFVVHVILGWGVASNLRVDTQAKGLGELLRSRSVDVPAALVAQGKPAQRLAG